MNSTLSDNITKVEPWVIDVAVGAVIGFGLLVGVCVYVSSFGPCIKRNRE